MTPIQGETIAFQANDDDVMDVRPICSRQSSYKRHNSSADEELHNDDIPYKHQRMSPDEGTLVPCPLADFGCLPNVSLNGLKEHYTTELHQESLLKAVNFYSQQLQTTSKKTEKDSELIDTVEVIAEGLSCLHEDSVRTSNDITKIDNRLVELRTEVRALKSSVEETNQYIHANQMNHHALQTEMESIREAVSHQASQCSNDGTFIWKITDVAEKINEAIGDRQTSIYSPPFYSSPTGYKMCMRLYLNGDGQARKTHMSLFFVLLRGDYDAVLQWPFSYKITFCLFNQTGSQQHLIDSFRPDAKSNSFQRPRSSMNIASGIPRFCSTSLIQQHNSPYVRDDCMFIRCIVDFSDMPKTMISYVCCLNPGLPTGVKRAMCDAEIQRQKQPTPVIPTDAPTSTEKVDN